MAIQRLAEHHIGQVAEVLKPHALSPAQYNVLRILRGAGPDGVPCGMVAERLITRDPDITRLVDRLEARGLVERARSTTDRRVVTVRATAAALDVLSRLEQPTACLHAEQFKKFNKRRLEELLNLLEDIQ